VRAAQRPLSPGWVAGSVRARHMGARRLGHEQSRALAASPSLEYALGLLSGSAYGRSVRPGMDLASAQHAIGEAALWHVRVLAGWMPPRNIELVRVLAAWFELANVEDRLAYLAGGPLSTPFVLGGLATAGTRVQSALTVAELREALMGSSWGDPGSDEPDGIRLALRFSWARRALASVPEARQWVLSAVVLLLARELLLAGRPADELAALRPPVSGTAWMQSASVEALRGALGAESGGMLAGIDEPDAIWLGEAAWWHKVDQDAERLARDPQMGRATVIGVVALLGVDAWRVAAALESAARGGGGIAIEAFEHIA
jgi:hypothetical protein